MLGNARGRERIGIVLAAFMRQKEYPRGRVVNRRDGAYWIGGRGKRAVPGSITKV